MSEKQSKMKNRKKKAKIQRDMQRKRLTVFCSLRLFMFCNSSFQAWEFQKIASTKSGLKYKKNMKSQLIDDKKIQE